MTSTSNTTDKDTRCEHCGNPTVEEGTRLCIQCSVGVRLHRGEQVSEHESRRADKAAWNEYLRINDAH